MPRLQITSGPRSVLAATSASGPLGSLPGPSGEIVNERLELTQRERDRPDRLIIDAVAHPYNQTPENRLNRLSTVNGAYSYHVICNPPEHRLTESQWAHDWQPDEFIETMLLESSTDIICMHSVPLFESAKDGLVANWKGAYLKKHYPDRIIWYAALDLGEPREKILALANEVLAQGADGIKVYPTGTNQATGQTSEWFMDDTQIAFPVFDHLRACGVRHIAVHKLLEYDALTLTKKQYYGVNDIAAAARRYPDITFHLVHAGWVLSENTILLMREYPNVTAVLEGPMLWPVIDPPRFDTFMYMFMTGVGSDRLMYSSAATNPHPRWLIEGFDRYAPPSGGDGGFVLTQADKDGIMGNNFARIHGIDIAERKAKIADDRFSRFKAKHGLRPPWTAIRGAA